MKKIDLNNCDTTLAIYTSFFLPWLPSVQWKELPSHATLVASVCSTAANEKKNK
jgi:hypothetical protein